MSVLSLYLSLFAFILDDGKSLLSISAHRDANVCKRVCWIVVTPTPGECISRWMVCTNKCDSCIIAITTRRTFIGLPLCRVFPYQTEFIWYHIQRLSHSFVLREVMFRFVDIVLKNIMIIPIRLHIMPCWCNIHRILSQVQFVPWLNLFLASNLYSGFMMQTSFIAHHPPGQVILFHYSTTVCTLVLTLVMAANSQKCRRRVRQISLFVAFTRRVSLWLDNIMNGKC